MSAIVGTVRVPGVGMIAGGGDEASPGFHQSPCQQRALSYGIAPVAIASLLRFLGEIECIANRGCQQHLPCLRAEVVHVGVFGGGSEVTITPVDHLEKLLPALH